MFGLRWLIALVAAVALVAAACGGGEQEATPGGLWAANCASCHGANGDGGRAPALNSKEFLENTTDEQIHSITAEGIPGTDMPLFWNELGGTLTDEQITALVSFMRSWEPSSP